MFLSESYPNEEKLGMALACMMGCAVTWLRNVHDREDLSDWKDFKDKLKKRFRPTRGRGYINLADAEAKTNHICGRI